MVTECVRCINNIKLVYNVPRKSKKLRFRGVAKQFLSELPEDINNPASSQRKPTASEKKLADARMLKSLARHVKFVRGHVLGKLLLNFRIGSKSTKKVVNVFAILMDLVQEWRQLLPKQYGHGP